MLMRSLLCSLQWEEWPEGNPTQLTFQPLGGQSLQSSLILKRNCFHIQKLLPREQVSLVGSQMQHCLSCGTTSFGGMKDARPRVMWIIPTVSKSQMIPDNRWKCRSPCNQALEGSCMKLLTVKSKVKPGLPQMLEIPQPSNICQKISEYRKWNPPKKECMYYRQQSWKGRVF